VDLKDAVALVGIVAVAVAVVGPVLMPMGRAQRNQPFLLRPPPWSTRWLPPVLPQLPKQLPRKLLLPLIQHQRCPKVRRRAGLHCSRNRQYLLLRRNLLLLLLLLPPPLPPPLPPL
jgi:hypothetical protein